MEDAAHEGDGLDGLAEAHLVREDHVGVGPPAVELKTITGRCIDTICPSIVELDRKTC